MLARPSALGLFGLFGMFSLFQGFLLFSVFIVLMYRTIAKNFSESTCGKSSNNPNIHANELG